MFTDGKLSEQSVYVGFFYYPLSFLFFFFFLIFGIQTLSFSTLWTNTADDKSVVLFLCCPRKKI